MHLLEVEHLNLYDLREQVCEQILSIICLTRPVFYLVLYMFSHGCHGDPVSKGRE